MRFIIKLLSVLILLSQESYSQIKIINSNTKEPVPFTEIYEESGRFLGFADEYGVITVQILEKVQKENMANIRLSHLGYKRTVVSRERLTEQKTIELEEEPTILQEITIKPSKTKPYYLIRGYHRSYNVIDGKLTAFTDGWIEFLYPTQAQKRVLLRRLDERFIEEKKELSSGILIIGPNIPTVNIPNEKYYVGYTYKDAFMRPYQAKLNSKSNSIIQEYSYISPDKPIINKLMGNETKIHNHHETVVFNCNNIEQASLSNMIYNKAIRRLEMKRKEREKPFWVDEVSEFFVFDFEELEEEPKGFGKFTGFNRGAIPKSKFWEKAANHPLFMSLPKEIEAELRKIITEN
ncbi:MAG: hypothetical protein ACK4NY_06065 [Spirosomataceae bacterium]